MVPTAMLAAEVMTVDPMMTVLRPMAGHPNHLVFAFPVTWTMAVIWPVTEFDAKPCRLNSGPESEARNADRYEQQYFLNHKSDSDADDERTGLFGIGGVEKKRPKAK
jgi:hypothetical protein